MKSKKKPTITVFTPTYNRAYCLHNGYEALCRQTIKDFLWIVVDDGSTDNTKELVKSWQSKDNGFEIRYIYKENGGLHTTYNVALELADKTFIQLMNTDINVSPQKAVEKTREQPDLFSAIDTAYVWLQQALRAK